MYACMPVGRLSLYSHPHKHVQKSARRCATLDASWLLVQRLLWGCCSKHTCDVLLFSTNELIYDAAGVSHHILLAVQQHECECTSIDVNWLQNI